MLRCLFAYLKGLAPKDIPKVLIERGDLVEILPVSQEAVEVAIVPTLIRFLPSILVLIRRDLQDVLLLASSAWTRRLAHRARNHLWHIWISCASVL